MIPHHAGAREAGWNSCRERISTMGVSRAVRASKKAAFFKQRDQCSTSAACPNRKSRVSGNSPSRIPLEDITISFWIRPQRAIGCCEWSRLNSCPDCGWPLWRVKINWKKNREHGTRVEGVIDLAVLLTPLQFFLVSPMFDWLVVIWKNPHYGVRFSYLNWFGH